MKKRTHGRFVRKEQRDREEGEKGRDEEELMDEGEVLIELLQKGVKETNQMVDFVIARMHQFVQA